MGFNIGVYSRQVDTSDCYSFIDRAFYNFINTGEMYGNKSILIRSGQYYGLDLSPLLKLVYTPDGVTDEYIIENEQSVDLLLDLLASFRDKIRTDNTVCDKVDYTWYDEPMKMSKEDIETLTKSVGTKMAKELLYTMERERKYAEENPNPWKHYFETGEIITELESLMKRLQCYKDKGATVVYLTAG